MNFRKDISTNDIIELYNSGLPQKDIAKIFNCPKSTVRGRLIRAKCKLRTSREVMINAFRMGRAKPLLGKNHPTWKGGRNKSQGYIILGSGKNRISEHRFIWEKIHNRRLPKGYLIHHLNGIRDDNRPENLLAVKWKDHNRLFIPLQERIRQLEWELEELRNRVKSVNTTTL